MLTSTETFNLRDGTGIGSVKHAVDGNPVPVGAEADKQWDELRSILSQYYGE